MIAPDPASEKTPPRVKARKSAISAILKGERPDEVEIDDPDTDVSNDGDDVENVPEEPIKIRKTSPREIIPKPTPPPTDTEDADAVVHRMFGRKRVKVRLANSCIRLTLGAMLHREDKSITIVLDREHVQLELNPGDTFELKAQALHCDVLYAGGFFTFPKSSFSLVSFLIENEHGKTSSS